MLAQTKPSKGAVWFLAVTSIFSACTNATGDTTVPQDTTSTSLTGTETTTTGAPDTTIASVTTTAPSQVNDRAEGSGCTPGEGELPDGEWYGEIGSALADEIEFDLACWFTGDAAADAAAEDGQESPPPNDYYVRNLNTTLRTVAVGDDVMVVWYPEIGDQTSETTIAYDEWRDALADRGEFTLGIWIEVENGVISHMREQWVP
jgi:hypothetical protein